jgi:hypothetical protein
MLEVGLLAKTGRVNVPIPVINGFFLLYNYGKNIENK